KSFAHATNQQFHIYYSQDTTGKKAGNIPLTGKVAEAAWNTPVKDAEDLCGCLPLIPEMPVFLTENIATELGLSKGSDGTLISVKYKLNNGKHIAVSVDVDFLTYYNPSQEFPH
ncbi:hypothetical protein M422DRAFT_133850, partial [Sphaerobolus stellatus SS14]